MNAVKSDSYYGVHIDNQIVLVAQRSVEHTLLQAGPQHLNLFHSAGLNALRNDRSDNFDHVAQFSSEGIVYIVCGHKVAFWHQKSIGGLHRPWLG